jgi:hypothetical protein
MITKNFKTHLSLFLLLSATGYSNLLFAQDSWDNKPKIIITQRPKIVPQGKRWVLLSGKKTIIQISDGTLNSGTLCSAMFLSNPRIIFNLNKGDYRDPETFGIIFKNLLKAPYTNDYTYNITPISIIDKDFSLNDLQYKSPENAGRLEIDFDEGESVFVNNCLQSIELTEVDVKEPPIASKINKDITYCYENGEYSIKIKGSNVTIYYTNLNHLDRSYTYKGYIERNKIYIKALNKSAKYAWEFTLVENHKLSMFDNNKKRWVSLESCDAPVNANALYKGNLNNTNYPEPTGNASPGNQGTSNGRIITESNPKVIVGLIQRRFINQPTVSNVEHLEGRVVVKLTVNRNGDVTSAHADEKGTTIIDSAILKKCEDAVKQVKITSSNEAPLSQNGVVLFVFKTN